jgi:threonyl-tRNA synthetase
MLVVGQKEKEAGAVSIRSRADKSLEGTKPFSEFVEKLLSEITERRLPVKTETPAEKPTPPSL